jgi:hypothetical protein
MKHLLFLTYVIGLLVALDAGFFDSRYRSEIWQQTKHQGEAFNREVERRIKEVFR